MLHKSIQWINSPLRPVARAMNITSFRLGSVCGYKLSFQVIQLRARRHPKCPDIWADGFVINWYTSLRNLQMVGCFPSGMSPGTLTQQVDGAEYAVLIALYPRPELYNSVKKSMTSLTVGLWNWHCVHLQSAPTSWNRHHSAPLFWASRKLIGCLQLVVKIHCFVVWPW